MYYFNKAETMQIVRKVTRMRRPWVEYSATNGHILVPLISLHLNMQKPTLYKVGFKMEYLICICH
jgi:hypothetical protein